MRPRHAPGEVLVEIRPPASATDYYTLSGADPRACSRRSSATKARASWSMSARRHHAQEGRPRDPALHARMPPVQVLPVAQDQPLPADPRHPGQGLMPDATSRFSLDGKPIFTTWAPRPSPTFTVLPESRSPNPRGRAVRQGLLHRLRRHHRHRRGDLHGAKGRRRAPTSWCFGLGGIGLNVIQGAQDGGRRQDHRRRPQPGARGHGAPSSA